MKQPFCPPQLTGRLLIDTAMGDFLGDRRIRLLEAIGQYGSISQAAKAVPLSYKAAWDAVDAMNNLAPEPLVLRTTGGRHGGGTQLTPFARRLIAFYRVLEQESQAALARLTENLTQSQGTDSVQEFRSVLRRLSMKSSARNQFAGPISALKDGVVDTEVTVQLAPDLHITAIITRESAETLGLAVGRQVLALVKASSIVLVTETPGQPLPAISARNQLRGEISHIHPGPVNTEVTLGLAGGQHVLTAVVTETSVQRLGLTLGQSVMAVFKAPSVFLVALD